MDLPLANYSIALVKLLGALRKAAGTGRHLAPAPRVLAFILALAALVLICLLRWLPLIN